MAARGQVLAAGRRFRVEGQAWMDHEFATAPLEPGLTGWDWFSLQLDDERELMLFGLRRPDGTWHPASSGTLVLADGSARHLGLESIRLEVNRRWRSPHTRAIYPAGWRLGVDGGALSLEIQPILDDQEMRTGASTGITYWEGGVTVAGHSGPKPVKGRGYVELTGYAGPFDAPM
jgi:predicted secreted hydrolase